MMSAARPLGTPSRRATASATCCFVTMAVPVKGRTICRSVAVAGKPAVRLSPTMYHSTRPGWIEVIAGVMFSGKSEELIRRVRRAAIARQRVQVFKSHLDSRYAGLYSISSHDGGSLDAAPVDTAAEVFRQSRVETQLVAVDEVQ